MKIVYLAFCFMLWSFSAVAQTQPPATAPNGATVAQVVSIVDPQTGNTQYFATDTGPLYAFYYSINGAAWVMNEGRLLNTTPALFATLENNWVVVYVIGVENRRWKFTFANGWQVAACGTGPLCPGWTPPPPVNPPPLTCTCATRSNDFLKSLGVNVHIDQGVSGQSYVDLLNYVKVRNIRSGAGHVEDLLLVHSQAGVLVNIFTNGWLDGILSSARTLAANGALLSIEGANEPNNFPFEYNGQMGGGQGDWTPVANFQKDLYAAVKSDPALKDYPVFGTSETGGQVNNVGLQFLTIPSGANTLLPAGTKFADYVNIHNYVSSTQNFYGDNMAWNAANPLVTTSWDSAYLNVGVTWYNHFQGYSNAELSTIPKVTTETGWDSTAFGERIQGIVLVNNLLAQFKQGWKYTFIYQLRDGEGGPGNQGIFKSDSSPKLAATYIRNLTSILADPTPINATRQLSYAIANQPDTVHDLLLQKGNGSFLLVVWGEKASGSVPLNVSFTNSHATINVYDVTSGTSPVQTFSNANNVSLTLSDHAYVLEVIN
jgi:hypothetical protein